MDTEQYGIYPKDWTDSLELTLEPDQLHLNNRYGTIPIYCKYVAESADPDHM